MLPLKPKGAGLDDQPVRSMGGLRVVPDITLDTVERGNVDALVLPGGTFWPELVHPPPQVGKTWTRFGPHRHQHSFGGLANGRLTCTRRSVFYPFLRAMPT